MENFFLRFINEKTINSLELLVSFIIILIFYDVIKAIFIKVFDSFFEIRKSHKITMKKIFFEKRLDLISAIVSKSYEIQGSFIINFNYNSEILKMKNLGIVFLDDTEIDVIQKIDTAFVKYNINKDISLLNEISDLTAQLKVKAYK